ncbi:transposase [Dictyobacter aurantiacus]|uniref:Transposase IS4-like domain-containing protein n=1 Tax=Dictyobacter aurantiacus TaxID=1936993 RepID=A0A401ZJE4_9CHLR|nr:transposase [Dictyobacter aurantiacus]GCE02976.1 hypothetical protein KDAU_03050 [Dictyobacter aurantiacus]GCE05258.1 hypothetical protein KDAU_25870 [Dictyobacter aurantiacus]GCE06963.1 hypothetical protein KDAU_42920 [Dictyobacter aurantiacus]
MHTQYRTVPEQEQLMTRLDQEVAGQFVHRLDAWLAPLYVLLDAYLDRRLVRTFADVIVSIIQLRHREAGLLQTELGAMLLSPQHAPAASKRIQRLLSSTKWGAWLIDQFLWQQATKQLETLEHQGCLALVLHDGSELEKPESVKVEGLCPVRSSKGRRLSRPRPKAHCISPTKGAPILVPGIHWHGAVLIGLQSLPSVIKMHYWSSRGSHASTGRIEEERVVRHLAQQWGRRVIHVFDRGWAGGPWLQVMHRLGQRFVERWTGRYELVDEQGTKRKAWEIARGKRQSVQGTLWWAAFGREITLTIKWRLVRHAEVEGMPLYLVVASAKEWSSPWYLLTNEPVEEAEAAMRIVNIYCRRWQIEWSFRFEKSELGIEHMRVRGWERQLKFLGMVTLVYAFLLQLLMCEGTLVRLWALDRWDHQTGKRARQTRQPLYRLRRGLSRLWQAYRPQAQDRPAWLGADLATRTPNFCSESSG